MIEKRRSILKIKKYIYLKKKKKKKGDLGSGIDDADHDSKVCYGASRNNHVIHE
jgi:hypothetical protein